MICMGVPFVGVTSSFTCRRFDYNTKHEYAQSGPCCVTPGQIQKLMSIVIYDSPMRNWTGTTNFTRESVLATIFSVLNLRRSRETPLMSKPKCLKNLALQIPCIHGIAKKKKMQPLFPLTCLLALNKCKCWSRWKCPGCSTLQICSLSKFGWLGLQMQNFLFIFGKYNSVICRVTHSSTQCT